MSVTSCFDFHLQFIALYDYDPFKSSPCEHPEFELSFSEGDLIRIYGQEMDDGFMAGEVRLTLLSHILGTVNFVCSGCDIVTNSDMANTEGSSFVVAIFI